ncbi:MAG: K(+)-transporting ATPase subunit F [Actinomycetales bacterium]|nr:K(+)-transporting ATPase subunit F [Actinomycetales bacterium]
MTWLSLLALLTGTGLLAYLVVALVRAERF